MTLFQSRTYWNRAWIVQELVLAQDILFFCGSSSISWSDLLSAVSETEKNIASNIRTIAKIRSSNEEERSFEKLFAQLGHLNCALDHDKFYSLYGMAKGALSLGGAFPTRL